MKIFDCKLYLLKNLEIKFTMHKNHSFNKQLYRERDRQTDREKNLLKIMNIFVSTYDSMTQF